ncbi:MAG: class I SAM-dependent methyltransferase [Actinomycetota bacterium]|nr:class I SAM-dependent methyltransferase [Actinomycetota bacterium]
MRNLRPKVKRVGHRLVAALPAAAVERVPGRAGQRIRAVRSWQQEKSYLAPGSVSPVDNLAYNRSLWDWYAGRWSDPGFLARQLSHEGRSAEDPSAVGRLGEEWGRLDDVRAIVNSWILSQVDRTSVAGEIGTGGGRVATMVAPHVAQFHAFDLSAKMLELAREQLRGVGGTSFHVLDRPELPADLTARFDFVYSFDVFVHLDLHVQWQYLQEFHRVLKPGGKAFIHTANLTASSGWERFVAQDRYRVEGFYFMTPQGVRTLIERSGLRLLEEVGDVVGNFYTERDYLVLVEKPGEP